MADTLRLSPVICAYPDDNYENFLIEVVLPEVEKKDISFKITENSFYVAARKEGVQYLDSYSTCCQVNPEKGVAIKRGDGGVSHQIGGPAQSHPRGRQAVAFLINLIVTRRSIPGEVHAIGHAPDSGNDGQSGHPPRLGDAQVLNRFSHQWQRHEANGCHHRGKQRHRAGR